MRLDTCGYPVVIPQGSVFVTAGTDRRSSGTHYTPRELTEPIVKYTLEPLVYVGPADGVPKANVASLSDSPHGPPPGGLLALSVGFSQTGGHPR